MTERTRGWVVGLIVIGIFVVCGILWYQSIGHVQDCLAALNC